MSPRRALAGVACLALAACGATEPRAEAVASSVELVLVDARPPARDGQGDFVPAAFVIPFLPWSVEDAAYYPQRSLAPELEAAVGSLNLFDEVLGPGDPPVARDGAPYVLTVTLLETRCVSRFTAYGLGPLGVVFYALGAPSEYTRAVIALRAHCAPRGQPALAAGEGDASDLALTWLLYGETDREPLEELVREALAEALDGLLD